MSNNMIMAAEKVLADLRAKRDGFAKQVEQVVTARKGLAYAVHVDHSEAAKSKLDLVNKQLAEVREVLASVEAALVMAREKLDAAKRDIAHDAFTAARARIEQSLISLVDECAPELDKCWGKVIPGSAAGFCRVVGPKNPGLYVKSGTLVTEITKELKTLRLDRAIWPPARFELMHIDDFRIELEKLVSAYQHGRLVRARNFVHLIGDWSASVRAALAQHGEQTTNNKVAA